jgi:hypothetical protein
MLIATFGNFCLNAVRRGVAAAWAFVQALVIYPKMEIDAVDLQLPPK